MKLLNMLTNDSRTIHSIAITLGVSIRTVERDMEILRISGYPLVINEKNEYTLLSGSEVPMRSYFNDAETI
ncbi:MAG: HTH domain-containing protein [Planctomycetia bacterium]|nr:HTH domain-containing protein [Planctomycetia bacterium]